MNIPLAVLVFSLIVAAAGLAVRTALLLRHVDVPDPSPPRASAQRGIVYAFTGGMLPWKKESATLHRLAYLRGIVFHIGIVSAILLLLLSIFVDQARLSGNVVLGTLLTFGFLAGAAGLTSRFVDRNLRAISRPGDYVSVLLVTLVFAAGIAFVFDIAGVSLLWITASVLCLYVPWSKVPHVVYFFFSRINFGTHFGRRGVVPHCTSIEREERV